MKRTLSDPVAPPARLRPAAWALALVGTGALLAAVVAPPFLSPVARAPLMAGFHALCHQLPERSFFVDGVQLAACHRCTGIYAGLVLGVLTLPFWRAGAWGRGEGWGSGHGQAPPRSCAHASLEGLLLLIAVAPAALDWGGGVLGLWDGAPASRVATGLWFGAIAGFLFARAVAIRVRAGRGDTGRERAAV